MSFDPDRNWRDQLEAWRRAYLDEPEGRAKGKRDLDRLRQTMSAWLSDGGSAPEAWRNLAYSNVAPRVTEYLWAGHVEAADRALERQHHAREERLENPRGPLLPSGVPTSLRFIGHCAVCTRKIKVRGGLLVHHGYERPGWGHILGDCFGVDRPPHELSDACAREYLHDPLAREISAATDRVAYLEDPRLLSFKRREHDFDEKNVALPMTFDELVDARLAEARSDRAWATRRARAEWDRKLAISRREADERLRSALEEERRVRDLIATWQLLPLQTVDEEISAKRENQAARAAAKALEIQLKLDEALASFRKRLDAAVKNRNANAVRDLFENGYRKYMDISYRSGAPGGVERRLGVLRLVDRDHVWRAFGLIDADGNYLDTQAAIADAWNPWSHYRVSRPDLERWDPRQERLQPAPWPDALGGGKTKTPA